MLLAVFCQHRKINELRRALVGVPASRVQLKHLREDCTKALSSTVNATQVEADLDPLWAGTVNVTISLKCEVCLEKSEVLWVQQERVM